MFAARNGKLQRGFTLVELIVTLTILSLVSIGIFGFIETSTSGYVESKDREALQSQARFAVERLGRELRHAVPNSVSTSNNGKCLSYFPISYTGFSASRDKNSNTLTVALATDDADWQTKVADGKHRIVFMPSKPSDLNAGSANSLAVTGASSSELGTNKPIGELWPSASPSNRFYLYSDKVTFCFEGSQLTREVDNTSGSPVTLAKNLDAAASGFTVGDETLSGGNLINIAYAFKQSGETSFYNQQVQVLNAP
ncbi:PilW family protein [Enterovibrio paralichthyis]|uniref:PilW family protein n=1 Tax=Enterovibrio paralichthyis TaxID=2853805 RepID=UPI001C490965|nr:prepilin-type N-terminal cleavage/methylation domain-containing protein [Enterovibrio paralichthyis]MBV7297974.1 prepilin-type N-terminal cleavage/methylation domain-containing protein [Enterovibrio paralichthyis]